MLIIKPLITDRQKWPSACLYTTEAEVESFGYELLYASNEGYVYGECDPERINCLISIAFVPYKEFTEKYKELAFFEPEKYKGFIICRTKKSYSVVSEEDWTKHRTNKFATRRTVESCKGFIDRL